MDGSSEPFVFLIECAGIQPLSAMREVLEVTRVVAVEEGGSTALIAPSDHFSLDITIQFDHQKVGTQQAVYDFELTSFNQSLSRARTFGFARDVQMLREKGLAKGASLNNAIALGDDHDIMNKEGLRYDNEFVRHKALDCVGDYYLAGYIIRGAVTTFRPGHGINNLLIRELLADERNYRLVPLQGVMPAPEVIANNVAVVSAAV